MMGIKIFIITKDCLLNRFLEYLLPSIIYIVLSVFFLFGLIIGSGDVAQGDWSIPLTENAALNDFSSRLFVRSFNGFGETFFDRWCFPFLPLFNAAVASFGFVGGAEIKLLSVFLVSLGGITAYLLARSFRLSRLSSFLSGLFFMSTPVVFNWIIFGWIGYLIGYALFPLTILCTKKFLETSDLRYALMNGLILALGTIQPTMIVIYPIFGLLFVVFESKGNFLFLKRGIILSIISLTIWVLMAMSFFTSFNNAETLSYYHGEYIDAIKGQFVNLSSMSNAIRLWGSTYNFQFETYFPKQLIIFSFLPVVIAMLGLIKRSLDRRVLFFAVSFLFVFFSFFIYHNLTYLISSLPYGAIFEAPSIFLVPASLALAILIAYANQAAPFWSSKMSKIISHASLTKVIFSILLISIVLSGFPWWAGEVSGNPISGPPTKLNLYQIPEAYTTWSNNLITNQQYFVLYLPLSTNVKINDSIFSNDFEGVNQGIFTQVNDLPYVSISNASLFLDNLMSGIDGLGQKWGSYSIRYIVVYTNVLSDYNMSDILDRLSAQEGIVPVESLPDVKVFENKHALPVVYPIGNNVELNIINQDPVSFKVEVNSSVPFTLVLNQVYSKDWKVWVNGSIIPATAQFKSSDGFNSWRINETGHLIVDIYYEPQTMYLISKIIATIVLLIVSIYIITRTIGNLVRTNKSGRADSDNSVKPFVR